MWAANGNEGHVTHSPTQARSQRKALVLEMPVLSCLLQQMGEGPPGDSQVLHHVPVREGEFENKGCLRLYRAGLRSGLLMSTDPSSVKCWERIQNLQEVNCSQTKREKQSNSMTLVRKNSPVIMEARSPQEEEVVHEGLAVESTQQKWQSQELVIDIRYSF